MEEVLKGVGAATGTTAIEIPVEAFQPEPEAGFPWCGVGIGVGVVVLAAVLSKLYKSTSKK
jgi:hypothetical protein